MKRNKLIYSFDVYKYKMGTLNSIFEHPLRCLNVSVLTLKNCMLFDVGRLNLIVTYIVNFFPLFFTGKKKTNKNDNLKKCISFQFLKIAHVQCNSLVDLPLHIKELDL